MVVYRRRGMRGACGNRHWRYDRDCFEVTAAGAIVDFLCESSLHAPLRSNFADRQHARFLSETLVSGPLTLSGHDHPRSDIKERAIERALAEPRCAGGVRHRIVLHQRMALPETVSRL